VPVTTPDRTMCSRRRCQLTAWSPSVFALWSVLPIPHGPAEGDAEGDAVAVEVAVASTGRVLSIVVEGCVLSMISVGLVRSIGVRAGVRGASFGE
jgi:hypothetical protein